MQHKYNVVGILLGLSLMLVGCGGGPLRGINDDQASGLPTAPANANLSGSQPFTPPSPNGAEGAASDAPVASAAPDGLLAPVDSGDPAAGSGSSGGEVPPPSAEAPAPVEPTAAPTVAPFAEQITLPSAQDRWRYVQVDRAVLPAIQNYQTSGTEILWWYDPIFGRTIKLGEIQGSFPVQATFRFRGQEVEALEVPYQINQSFGITLPQATIDEMREAGVTDWAETFVYVVSDIRPE